MKLMHKDVSVTAYRVIYFPWSKSYSMRYQHAGGTSPFPARSQRRDLPKSLKIPGLLYTVTSLWDPWYHSTVPAWNKWRVVGQVIQERNTALTGN